MKTQSSKPHPKLKQLQSKVGGTVEKDGELYYGAPGKRQIFISTEDGKDFLLWSERPLYTISSGRPRLAKALSSGDAKGWYRAKVAEADVETALQFAMAQSDPEFSYECVLHDYCARHLDAIEDGLTLYQKGRISGLEVNVDGHFIDILAVDSAKNLVVIETKRSQAKRQTIDQLLAYMGWVRQHIAKPSQGVRGIIIARQIGKDLQLAASAIADVQLVEYRFSITFSQMIRRPNYVLQRTRPSRH